MSENRDEATGQFAATEEPLYGQASIERDAGYVPYKPENEEPKDDGALTVDEAKAKLDEIQGTDEGDIQTFSALSDLPENVTLTIDQAKDILDKEGAAEVDKAEEAENEKTREWADKLRGEKPADEQTKEQVEPAKEQPDANANDLPLHDDPDIAKALSKPQFVEAIKAYDSQLQQQVSQAVERANDFARVSFAENFPEIATLPPQQWEAALVAMARQEPERFKTAVNSLNRVAQLHMARQQQQAEQQHREQIEFQQYAKAEDARFAEMVKDEPPARMREIEKEIPQMLSELGVDPLEFFKAGNESRFLRTAAAQKVLVDAARYRLIKKASIPKPSPAPPPRVQRPGHAGAVRQSQTGDLAALDRRLAQTGSVEDAWALYEARTKRRG